jgi:nucleoside-diphosphate-sugar epimerase
MRQNFASEQIFDWAQIGAVHVRATIFYENLRALVRLSLPTEGAMQLPWGDAGTRVPLVSAEDVARLATGLLAADSAPLARAYPLVGEVISVGAIVETLGRVLGRVVRYREISDDQWRQDALARGFNAHAVEHLSALWRAIRSQPAGVEVDPAVSDSLERIGGAPPTSFEAFVRSERDALSTAA